jgi:GNAT superfamily N-acetyltransferase
MLDIHQHIITNFYTLFEYLSKNSDSKLTKYKDFSSVETPDSVWPNFTFDVKLELSTAKFQLENIINSININQTPNHIIFDDVQLDEYEELLVELEFIPLAEWACLEFNPKEVSYKKHDDGLEIKRVTTEEELKLWVNVASTGFGKLDVPLFQKCLENKELIFYSGYYQSKIVATGLLFYNKETVGIYHVVTLPEFKKKGFGTQIFNYCQQVALQKGAKHVIAQSTQEGLNSWKKIGMKQYGNFYLFCWNKPKP